MFKKTELYNTNLKFKIIHGVQLNVDKSVHDKSDELYPKRIRKLLLGGFERCGLCKEYKMENIIFWAMRFLFFAHRF